MPWVTWVKLHGSKTIWLVLGPSTFLSISLRGSGQTPRRGDHGSWKVRDGLVADANKMDTTNAIVNIFISFTTFAGTFCAIPLLHFIIHNTYFVSIQVGYQGRCEHQSGHAYQNCLFRCKLQKIKSCVYQSPREHPEKQIQEEIFPVPFHLLFV